MPDIAYRNNMRIMVNDFIDVLKRSTLAERRPAQDTVRLQKMLAHANVMVTAWAGEQLVGVSRAITDFSFCCYLSDLAVDEKFQRAGIGRQLISLTHETAGHETTLILLSASAATKYYPRVGMKHLAHCFIQDRKQ